MEAKRRPVSITGRNPLETVSAGKHTGIRPNFMRIPVINVTSGQTHHVHEKGVAFKIVILSDAHV